MVICDHWKQAKKGWGPETVVSYIRSDESVLQPVGGTFFWEQNVRKERGEKLQRKRGPAAEFLLNFHWVARFKCVLNADFGGSEPKDYGQVFWGKSIQLRQCSFCCYLTAANLSHGSWQVNFLGELGP